MRPASTRTDSPAARAFHRLAESLGDPRRYPHPVDRVERIETHISLVLLAGDYAYKLKKPYDLGFLDFTRLAARRHYCKEELRLNRRLAPELYLDVVPITGSVDAPCIGGAGTPIEYAVRMRRFPQSALLGEQVAQGILPAGAMADFAANLARFHADAAQTTPDAPWGAPALIAEAARANFAQLMPLVSSARMRAQLDALSAWTEAALRRLEPEFATRRQAGFVRECHGDLHLGNLVLIEDRIRAFDCIEFNAAFRWIDTMSEVAFLVMDCASRGHAELGFGFLNAYLEHTGDFGGLRVLRFYLVFRAVVRAKIAALWAGEDARSKLERRRAWADCRHYLSLAQQFAASPTPLLVLMHGLSGSGKSSIARLLAGTLPAIHIRSDVERKRLFGLPPLARTASAVEGGIYNADATAQTYARLEAIARDILEAGFAVIVDATFLQRAQRQAFIPLWPAVAIVHCEAPLRTLRQRVAARHAAATDAAEADLAVLDAQRASREPLDAAEEALTVRVDSRRYPSPRRLAARLRRRALRG